MSGLATRRVLLPALALVSAGALLAGCAQESTSTATSAAAVPASSAAASDGRLDRRLRGRVAVGRGRPRRVLEGEPHPRHAGHPDHRHRLARLPALLRRRRPDERAGLRVGRGLRRRRDPRLRARGGHLDGRALQQVLRPRRQGLRLRHQPDLDHPEAAEGRRLLERLLHGQPGRRRPRGLADRQRDDARRAAGRQARRAGRHDEPGLHHRRRAARRAAATSTTTPTTRRAP